MYTVLEDFPVPAGIFLEIGSEQGEGSTSYIHALAESNSMPFYTVDFNEQACASARRICGPCATCMLGEDFISSILPQRMKESNLPVAFAYLDNYDWTFPGSHVYEYKKQQLVDYESHGLILSNERSRQVHLNQTMLLEPLVAIGGFILYDDTWMYGRNGNYSFDGKGGNAVDFLLDTNRWVVAYYTAESDPTKNAIMLQKILDYSAAKF